MPFSSIQPVNNYFCECIFKCNQSTDEIIEWYQTNWTLNTLETSEEIEIFSYKFEKSVIFEELDIIFRYLKRDWMFLQNAVLATEQIVEFEKLSNIRNNINRCFSLILQDCSLINLHSGNIEKEIKVFDGITLSLNNLEHILKLAKNNEQDPIYQYFHIYLEIKYYILTIWKSIKEKHELEQYLSKTMLELVEFSKKLFEQRKDEIFACNCLKHFWIFLGMFTQNDEFWDTFNKLMINNYDPIFVITLLKELAISQAKISKNQPNYHLLEVTLKNLLKDQKYDQIQSGLKLIQPLTTELWLENGRIEIYQILWEYFSKNLNNAQSNFASYTTKELIDIIENPSVCNDSFELFLFQLNQHLLKFASEHWSKIKGRIYSQLSPQKFKDLNDNGLFHVMLLFVILSHFDESASRKYLNLLENLDTERRSKGLIFNFHTAYLHVLLKKNESIQRYSQIFTNLLHEATSNKKFHLVQQFITDFHQFLASDCNLQLHQWTLIDDWINKYLLKCHFADMVTTFDILLKLVTRINEATLWIEWGPTFTQHIYPAIKTMSSLTAPEQCGVLAAEIVVNLPNLLTEAVPFFNDVDIAPKISANFLLTLSKYSPILNQNQEILSMQTWLKTVLLSNASKTCTELTNFIVGLNIVPQFVKIELGKTPTFQTFIECLGGNSLNPISHKLCEQTFHNSDKYISKYLASCENKGIVVRIYVYIALAFRNIGTLLYDKHRMNIYSKLVTAMLLPGDVLRGTVTPNEFILLAIKKTWHLFFESTVKLNINNDSNIDKIQKDLIVKYIPHYSIADSPILKCLETNEKLAEIILEKISNNFFRKNSVETEANVLRALELVKVFVKTTTNENSLRILVCKSLAGLLELVMFNSVKNKAFEVVKNVVTNQNFPKVQQNFDHVLCEITENFLAFYSNEYFQMMQILSKISNLKNVVPKIKQKISNVERIRGVGYDKNLRSHLEQLLLLINTK